MSTLKDQKPGLDPDTDVAENFTPRWRWKVKLQVNHKAVIVLVSVIGLLFLAYNLVGRWQERKVRLQLLSHAKANEEAKNIDLAIRNLRQYCETHPKDLAPFEELARMVAITAVTPDEAMAAANINDRLLRRDPKNPERQETRRRLVSLYIRCGDAHRASAIFRLTPEQATFELRYKTAAAIARDLLELPGSTAADHGLLAMALEGLAVPGDQEALNGAITEYNKALAGDPGNLPVVERLARLYQERLNKPELAERILDGLVAARPESWQARLIRYRYFSRLHRTDKAQFELDEAAKAAPDNVEVRVTSASDALRRGDTAAARRHLAAIPNTDQAGLRVRVMRGMVEFSEEHPDEAIDSWRQGLLTIGGTDAELTWWLAHALLQMGRVAEAEPLVAQFRRLAGADDQPLFKFLQAEFDERTGRPTRSLIALEWARDRIGENWQAMLQMALGRCYEALWDESRALASFRRANQIDPRMVEARIAAARLLFRKPEEAVSEVERGLAQNPDDPALQAALVTARLREQLARPMESRTWTDFDRAMTEALRITPTNSALLIAQSERLTAANRPGDAIALLERAAAKAPKNPAIWTKWAQGLTRQGKPAEALAVLERAVAPGNVGNRAAIRVVRAEILLNLNRGREARDQLIRDEKSLTLSERPLVWEALGRIDSARGDLPAARAAFTEWSRLLRDDPRPRLALLELAQTTGDEASVWATIESIRQIGGGEDIAYRLCRAQELLWARTTYGQLLSRRDPQMEEANRILDSVLLDAPEIPAGLFLQGQVLERLGMPDRAIASYRHAWSRGAKAALPRLVELLTRQRRFDDLADLRTTASALEVHRLSAQASYRAGDIEAAVANAAEAAQDDSNSPGSRAWQAALLELVGKPDQAEVALQAIVDAKPTDIEPWLTLIQSQAAHGKARLAAATCERARAQIKADNRLLVDARLRWASHDIEAANRGFTAALQAQPDDPQVLLRASSFYESTARLGEAIGCLKRLVEVEPKNRRALRQLSVLLAGDPTTWEQAANLIGPEGSGDDEPDDRLARSLVFSRSPLPAHKARAIDLLEALAADMPVGGLIASQAREVLTRLLLETNQPDRAANVAVVLASSGSNPDTLALYIETLLRSHKDEEASRQIERLATLRPDDPNVGSFRVRLVRQSSTPAETPEALVKFVRDRIGSPGGELCARESFITLVGLGAPALGAAEQVAAMTAEKYPTTSWMSAYVAIKQGKSADALDLCGPSVTSSVVEDRRGVLTTALEVIGPDGPDSTRDARIDTLIDPILKQDSTDFHILVLGATIRHKQTRYDDEVRLFQAALVVRPFDESAANNLAWSLSECLNRPREALPIIDAVIGRAGRAGWLLDTRGVILTRLGRLDEAIVDLKEANARSATPVQLFHLARACRKAKQEDDFVRFRDQAKQAGLTLKDLDLVEWNESRPLLD